MPGVTPLQRSPLEGRVAATSSVSLRCPHTQPPPSVAGDKCRASSSPSPPTWTGETPVLCSEAPSQPSLWHQTYLGDKLSVKSTPAAFGEASEERGEDAAGRRAVLRRSDPSVLGKRAPSLVDMLCHFT